ncbi:hypothetical protein A5784_31515 [Mycobacterium sp. 852013-50091_SCH5140682]|uniref:hypothetical protein n=1 Tax=Mycobacterium sp. 852013-50091_SCH5140682 TaxID=1834109 RepID=UPI0007EA518D|nr:hypothetical protein [Mycobacterium sp. 852013-50091_SCH5140682]OBC13557.1 hypothetical protein A5784_31515 [Mycobacterium sp. 852013-50091_SCH5140682]
MVAPLLHPGTTSWFSDYPTATPSRESDMATMTSALDDVLGAELAGARAAMGSSAEEILLAALGRTVARTIGEGVLDVDVDGDLVRRASVACSSHRSLSGYDLLTTVTRSAAPSHDRSCADVHFGYDHGGRGSSAPTGYLLSLHVHPDSGAGLKLEWTYDTRGFDPATVAELAEQFPLALIEVTSG